MTFYLPNSEIRPIGVEVEEFLDSVRLEPRRPDASPDRGERAREDRRTDEDDAGPHSTTR
jgi:hypothetical protein